MFHSHYNVIGYLTITPFSRIVYNVNASKDLPSLEPRGLNLFQHDNATARNVSSMKAKFSKAEGENPDLKPA